MEQPDLFTGAELRDFGIAAAERDRQLMIDIVDDVIDYVSQTVDAFTAETVRSKLGPNIRQHEDLSKVIGARMRSAATRGLIYTLGETVTAARREAHARRLLVWYRKEAA